MTHFTVWNSLSNRAEHVWSFVCLCLCHQLGAWLLYACCCLHLYIFHYPAVVFKHRRARVHACIIGFILTILENSSAEMSRNNVFSFMCVLMYITMFVFVHMNSYSTQHFLITSSKPLVHMQTHSGLKNDQNANKHRRKDLRGNSLKWAKTYCQTHTHTHT